jgi:hypothetical protein
MTATLLIFASALLSSALTLALAYALYRFWGERRLDAELLQIQKEFESHVKSGVLAAGRELLPEFRKEVTAGFQDALQQSRAAGLAEDAAKVVTGAAGILGSGLENLFGLRPKK